VLLASAETDLFAFDWLLLSHFSLPTQRIHQAVVELVVQVALFLWALHLRTP
jgi:hypothetical protein